MVKVAPFLLLALTACGKPSGDTESTESTGSSGSTDPSLSESGTSPTEGGSCALTPGSDAAFFELSGADALNETCTVLSAAPSADGLALELSCPVATDSPVTLTILPDGPGLDVLPAPDSTLDIYYLLKSDELDSYRFQWLAILRSGELVYAATRTAPDVQPVEAAGNYYYPLTVSKQPGACALGQNPDEPGGDVAYCDDVALAELLVATEDTDTTFREGDAGTIIPSFGSYAVDVRRARRQESCNDCCSPAPAFDSYSFAIAFRFPPD